jgi:sterol desaturase/sphingolipid hydroxylase (fatty acid hydroxylase superfamily)
MFNKLAESLRPSQSNSLAKAFRRLGWTGFWSQVVLGAIPVVLIVYLFAFSQSPTGPRAGLKFVEYLTIVSFLILVFTTVWFYRYTRLAPRIADKNERPSQSSLIATVWTGVVASVLGIFFSLLVLLFEVGHLLFYFLSAPQVGVPVVQAQGLAASSWVSAVDILSLMSLILTLGAEVAVLIFGLWLLFRTTQPSAEFA